MLKSASLGMRPWTRLECARLLGEAARNCSRTQTVPSEVQELYRSLTREFQGEPEVLMSRRENLHAQIESVYARSMVHFWQTAHGQSSLRPNCSERLRQAVSGRLQQVVGTSGWTTAGPFVIYARGEYQSAPVGPSLPQGRAGFHQQYGPPASEPAPMPFAAISRFRLLDAYVGMNLANWHISFGKQSLWWGPGEEGTMLFTNNAEPLNKMFRINRVSPFRLPASVWLSRRHSHGVFPGAAFRISVHQQHAISGARLSRRIWSQP